MMAGDSVERHVEYMNRAAEADQAAWEAMKAEADREAKDAPVTSRIHIGFLLTSPGTSSSNMEAGARMLRSVIEEEQVNTPVRNLIEVRLTEVEARRVLMVELGDVKGKIEELMSIESLVEQEQGQSRTRSR